MKFGLPFFGISPRYYGEVAQAIEISCVDCHGTVDAYPTLRTSGPAAPPTGTDLSLLRNPDGGKRFRLALAIHLA